MSDKSAKTLTTERLILREATLDDADIILAIYNDPAFLTFVGDKNIRTLEEARTYLTDNFIASYRANGHGLMIVERKEDGMRIGCCGLVARPMFDIPDIGFAYLPDYCSQGYGFEAAKATLDHARIEMGLSSIQALVSPENEKSIGLIKKLGMSFQNIMRFEGSDADTQVYAL